MGYQIKRNELAAAAIRRVAREEISRILVFLSGKPPLQAKAIHEARRSVKKARGLLQLIRRRLPPDFFEKENGFFRTLGRRLAPTRDARVLAGTLVKLRKRGKHPPRNFQKLARQLHEDETRQALALSGLDRIKTALREAKTSVTIWPVDSLVDADLRGGLVKIYQTGRKKFRKTSTTESVEAFHAWRKRVKHLEQAMCLLTIFWRKPAKATLKKLKSLARDLGDAHDLAVFSEWLAHDSFQIDSKELRKLRMRAAKRRAALEKSARKLGKAVFSNKPRRFVERQIGLPN